MQDNIHGNFQASMVQCVIHIIIIKKNFFRFLSNFICMQEKWDFEVKSGNSHHFLMYSALINNTDNYDFLRATGLLQEFA